MVEMPGLPFKIFPKLWVNAPTDFSTLSEVESKQAKDLQPLIEEHRAAIEGERIEFSRVRTRTLDIVFSSQNLLRQAFGELASGGICYTHE